MYDSNAPRRIESIDGRSVAEIAAISIGTSALLVAATIVALTAAAAVGGDSVIAFVVALAVGLGTIAVGIAAARRTADWLATIVDRRRSAPPVRSRV